MSARRLVVHVGTPKTGSTSIQDALARLGPALRERGIHVPSAGRRHAASARHANLLGSLTGFRYDAARGGWPELTEEIRASDARSFVISDEALARTRPKHVAGAIAAITGLAADCALRVDVVGYVRPQCQYLDSSFADDVGAGRVLQPFDMYTADEFATRPVSRHPWLDYGRVFAPWRAAFGQRVAVTPFERSRLTGGLVRHFLGLLGAGDLASRAGGVPANVRCGAKELEVRRLTAVALRRAGTDHRRVVRVLEALEGLTALLVPDAPFAGLSGDRARGLMDRFAAVNAAFARDYRISASGVLFRDPPVDGLARPNRARWSDLSAVEQEAVREFVTRTVGVDPSPEIGGAGHRPRPPPERRVPRLEGIRRTGLLGALPWRVAWLLDSAFLRRQAGRLVRGARQWAAARTVAAPRAGKRRAGS